MGEERDDKDSEKTVKILIVMEIMEGRRGRGGPRKKYVDERVKLIPDSMARVFFKATQNRSRCKSMVADVLEDI